jgi:hypothetical protein
MLGHLATALARMEARVNPRPARDKLFARTVQGSSYIGRGSCSVEFGRARKCVSNELRDLIFRMVAENSTWGAPRIHGELKVLRFDLYERTVLRWMRRAARNPEPARRWLAFLGNHREAFAPMDFLTVPDADLRSSGGLLFLYGEPDHPKPAQLPNSSIGGRLLRIELVLDTQWITNVRRVSASCTRARSTQSRRQSPKDERLDEHEHSQCGSSGCTACLLFHIKA